MRVYFKEPVSDPQCSLEFLFPNETEIPARHIDSADLVAYNTLDARRFKLLQKDLMDLVIKVNNYLEHVETPVESKALTCYRPYFIKCRGTAKKAGLSPYIFSFVVYISTAYGESSLTLQLKKDWQVAAYTRGNGIASEVIKDVIKAFSWQSQVGVQFEAYSEFRTAITDSLAHSLWRDQRGFNIPSEEYVAA